MTNAEIILAWSKFVSFPLNWAYKPEPPPRPETILKAGLRAGLSPDQVAAQFPSHLESRFGHGTYRFKPFGVGRSYACELVEGDPCHIVRTTFGKRPGFLEPHDLEQLGPKFFTPAAKMQFVGKNADTIELGTSCKGLFVDGQYNPHTRILHLALIIFSAEFEEVTGRD